jgi:Transposase DNA-binding
MANQRLLKHLHGADSVNEISQAAFGDERLRDRGQAVAEAIRRSPGASLPAVMANDTELTGAYRFFNNVKVTAQRLLAPHVAATLERAKFQREVVVIHDTTECRYGGRRSGLGRLSEGAEGFLAHVTLVATAEGVPLPLGVAATEFLVRGPKKKLKRGKKRPRKAKYSLGPENEHGRWDRAAAATETALRSAGVRPIHIEDREGDSYLLLSEMDKHDRAFVIRMTHDRVLMKANDDSAASLSDAVAGLPVLADRDIQVSRRGTDRPPRALKKHPPREERTARS